MNIKRYYAEDMQEAMDRIRKELGADAVILSSKSVRQKGVAGLVRKRIVEVVAAYEPEKIPARAAANGAARGGVAANNTGSPAPFTTPAPHNYAAVQSAADQTAPQIAAPQVTPKHKEEPVTPAAPVVDHSLVSKQEADTSPEATLWDAPLEFSSHTPGQGHSTDRMQPSQPAGHTDDAGISRRLDTLQAMFSEFARGVRQQQPDVTLHSEVQALKEIMIKNEVEAQLAQTIALETQDALERMSAEDTQLSPRSIMQQLIAQRLGEPEPLRLKRFKRNIIMLMGPTGVGKTTSLVKLATYYAYHEHMKVGIINSDTYRVAAQEQLNAYTQILETPLSVLYSPDELDDVLAEHTDRDIVFIDTAGKRPTDDNHRKTMKEMVEKCHPDEVLLAISAATSYRTCQSIINNYRFLNHYKILFTKLDEAESLGILPNVCAYAGKPLSYITTGQNVPDDIALADVSAIIARIVG